ncbi:hypothetical protein DAPPUDRAFT_97342 [Daphnia pulex]|uniref:Uncharacterized protein n=1 Tax=Daphnia pulex TaxID=6669 RepID=E9FZN8_DAPPU|nr:hypothetical protein DAPPUDRAFT_97342 [Daphnia pulex]|eukprot:EFX87235.1 hypothetical protein DAPPUDRAFT_97342 [Daphnia pulex]
MGNHRNDAGGEWSASGISNLVQLLFDPLLRIIPTELRLSIPQGSGNACDFTEGVLRVGTINQHSFRTVEFVLSFPSSSTLASCACVDFIQQREKEKGQGWVMATGIVIQMGRPSASS